MTEREQLLAMLAHASVPSYARGYRGRGPAAPYISQGDEVNPRVKEGDEDMIEVHTGPDDAVARFTFDADGRLTIIAIEEC